MLQARNGIRHKADAFKRQIPKPLWQCIMSWKAGMKSVSKQK